ncbi:MAG: tail fiber protein [Bryobacteraceae bacterium]|jgi:microcystin-dependent protein
MDPFVAEIRIFPFNFAPVGWAMCNGQILPISQNTALFSLIGVYYGGNGTSNFALPNFQGMAPMHAGQGTGLTPRVLGETAGSPMVTLQLDQLGSHNHQAMAAPADGLPSPDGNTWGGALKGGKSLYAPSGSNGQMSQTAIAPTGGGGAHNNLCPYLTLNFCIALQGVFPARP